MFPLISLFLIPLVASAAMLGCRMTSTKVLKYLATALSLFPLAILLFWHTALIQSEVNYAWMPSLSIYFHLKVDTLSLIFLYLTAIILPVSLLAVRSASLQSPNLFFALVLFLEALLIIFFTTRDLAVFTIFWEAMLLPLYFIIAIWGGESRRKASLKFLIYMIAGSVLMIAAVLALYIASGSGNGVQTFDLDALVKVSEKGSYAGWVFAIFLFAFAVKTPLFPFHAWLPDAYCQAPTTGTILLSGLLSKAGIYGILRIGIELFPTFMKENGPLLLPFAITGVLYGALVAWRQADFKRLLAYSSFSHVNFVLAGLFIWSQVAHSGAILQAVNHSITITALFLVAGWLEQRLGSTMVYQASGLAQYLPKLCWITLFFVLSSVALPGTNNFIGELLILFGLFQMNPWLAALLGLTVIFSVIYMLRWMEKMYFGEPSAFQKSWIDIQAKEIAIAVPLILLILWIGIYPAPLLEQISEIRPEAEEVSDNATITGVWIKINRV
jgi:NADH-quinone oxidoreductase subunit M